ncbi:MAG: DUF6473 family protein, partial [Pseudomonadota bacterium]
MTYDIGRFGLDYFPCRYGASKVLFRGPRKSLSAPYVAFLGGSDTYGKFIEHPFPDLVERALGVPCVNLGCVNAGVDVFGQDPHIPDIAAQSRVTVVQVLNAQNMSNRLYTVHPRRNDRFLRPSSLLQTIYREVDFAEFSFNKHMLIRLHDISAERFETVLAELRQAWLSRMQLLLRRIGGRIVLLWLSDRRPDAPADLLANDPWFIGRAQLDALRADVSDLVEVIPSAAAQAQGTSGMVFA